MAAISDKTIIARIKAIIEADATIFHASTPTLINKVHTETPPTGRGRGRASLNYAEIIPPEENSIEVLDDEGSPSQMGNAEATLRPYTIIFYYKQIRADNNDRVYDGVANFRNAIKADRTLTIAGVVDAWISPWGFNLNPDNQSIVDNAVMTLNVLTSEVF